MSTILKALRRLEEDRSFEESRSLQERVTGGLGEQPRGSSRFKVLAMVASGFACAAVGGLVFAFWMDGAGEGPPAVAAAPIVPARVVEPLPAARPRAVAASPVDRAEDLEVVEAVGSWNDGVESSASPLVLAASPSPWAGPSRPSKPATPARRSVAEESSNEPTMPESVPPTREPAEAEMGGSAPRPELSSSLEPKEPLEPKESLEPEESPEPPEPQAPFEFAEDVAVLKLGMSPLPVIQQVKLSSVEVVQTIWHPLPAKRQALIRVSGNDEPSFMAEGDTVGTLVLHEIEPAGVVFDNGGVQIRRRVGTSGR